MRFRRLAINAVGAALLLCGAGCVAYPQSAETQARIPSGQRTDTQVTAKPLPLRQAAEAWHPIADGAEKSVIADKASGAAVVLFRFAPGEFSIRLLSDTDAPKSVAEWAKAAQGEAAVINGTYFNEDHSPSGFVAVDGKRIGNRSFDSDKSGLLLFVPELRIVDTKREKTDLDATRLANAAQSYPFYVLDGKPAISKDSGQVSRRSFIGQDEQGRTYLGVVPNDFVSLYALMRILADAGVSWRDVLNLDGGPSTGLVVTFGGATDAYDSFDPVPNVILVTRKAR